MKRLLILLCLPMVVLAQKTYVPDDNFEQKLINLGYDNMLDDSVSTASINNILSLDIAYSNITDLTGIEDFISLVNLECHDNQLTTLDLSNNINLEILRAADNQMNTLNLNNNNLLK